MKTPFKGPFSFVSKRGWREFVGDQRTPKYSNKKKGPQKLCPPSHRGIGTRVQKGGLNLWHGKDFLAPTPSVRQPPFETSDFFFCFRQGVARVSRDLGRDILGSENFMQESFRLTFRSLGWGLWNENS